MQKSKIEWTGYSINPIKGLCPVDCKDNQGKSYCYARRMYKRFKWNPEIRFIGRMELLNELLRIPKDKPCRIFMGSTLELFGDWVKPEWMETIFELVKLFPFFTFIFLTKCPQNLPKEFPDNCWVGVSATNHNELANRWGIMRQVKASVKFLSLEPLLDWADESHVPIYSEGIVNSGIQWLIIGACTPFSKKTAPRIEWVKEIVRACDKTNIPIFLKNNLKPLLDNNPIIGDSNFYEIDADYTLRLRQEFPNIKDDSTKMGS